MLLLAVETRDSRDNTLPLVGAQLREDRQRQNLGFGPLRLLEVAAPVAEPREALLLVERDRVVDLRADPLLNEVLPERIAIFHPHHELVVGVATAGELLG